jgi:hypothetical protein
LNRFYELAAIREKKTLRAKEFNKDCLLRKCLNDWKSTIKEEAQTKEKKADDFRRLYLLKHYYMNGIKRIKYCLQVEATNAYEFCMLKIKKRIFKTWKIYKAKEQDKYERQKLIADNHFETKMSSKYFAFWRSYSEASLFLLRERKKRIDEMRAIVKELLPDYGTTSFSSSFEPIYEPISYSSSDFNE